MIKAENVVKHMSVRKVIVQSEKIRQIYINEYIKAAEESGLSGEHTERKYLENKILGLGSPKSDKIFNTRKEDLDIPKEWLRIIEKPEENNFLQYKCQCVVEA